MPRSPQARQVSAITRFLGLVWAHQPLDRTKTPFYFLAHKAWTDTGEWHEYPLTTVPNTSRPGVPSVTDLYFAPNLFEGPRRLRRNALAGRWLYADLDEVTPQSLRDISPLLTPTLAWETSPGRYQAMWLLDRQLNPKRLEDLNRRFTYHVQADKGGWSLTKVLRVPGSTSLKYDEPHLVRLVPEDSTKRQVPTHELRQLLKDTEVDRSPTKLGRHPALRDLPPPDEVIRRHRKRMSVRARQLLNTKTVLEADDRSARLWELEHLLIDAGLNDHEILAVTHVCPWNKFRGTPRELSKLWQEIHKARNTPTDRAPAGRRREQHSVTSHDIKSNNLRSLPNTLAYDDFMNREWPKPSWLIEQCWMENAYGFLAGEYKAFKTMILLDMTLSVASGTNFLGKYAINNPGSVCYVSDEDRPWSTYDRMVRIAHAKGLTDTFNKQDQTIEFKGRSLPIYITNLPKLNLTEDEDKERLIGHVRKHRPRLLILETFYLLIGSLSEKNDDEVKPLLAFLADLARAASCSIIISHHFHKATDDRRFLDRVSGSNTFGRWFESALFAERTGDETDNTIRLMTQHRDGAPSSNKLKFVWDSDDDGQTFQIEHLSEDPDEEAANTIVNLGKASAGRWEQTISKEDWETYTEYMENLSGRDIPLLKIRNDLSLHRTEHVAHLAKRFGFKVKTKDGVRYLISR